VNACRDESGWAANNKVQVQIDKELQVLVSSMTSKRSQGPQVLYHDFVDLRSQTRTNIAHSISGTVQ